MIAKRVTARNQLGVGLNLSTKKTRKREFLEEMDRVVPWPALVALIGPHASGPHEPPVFSHRDEAAHPIPATVVQPVASGEEEALHDLPLFREFAGLDGATFRPPDETILRFRHLFEAHGLAATQALCAVNDLLQSKGLMLRAGTQ